MGQRMQFPLAWAMESLDTGDLVGFRGTGPGNRLIQFKTWGLVDHIGVVFRRSDLPGKLQKRLVSAGIDDVEVFLVETTLSRASIDVFLRRPARAVSLVDLRGRIQRHKGRVYFRSLAVLENYRQAQKPIPAKLREGMSYRLEDVYGRPYERNLLELLFASLFIPIGLPGWRPRLAAMFCSELVADLLISGFIQSPRLPAYRFSPADYFRQSHQTIGKVQGAALEGGIRLLPVGEITPVRRQEVKGTIHAGCFL